MEGTEATPESGEARNVQLGLMESIWFDFHDACNTHITNGKLCKKPIYFRSARGPFSVAWRRPAGEGAKEGAREGARELLWEKEPHGSHLLLKQTPHCPPRIEFMMTSNEMHSHGVEACWCTPPASGPKQSSCVRFARTPEGPSSRSSVQGHSLHWKNTIQLAVPFNFI